MPLTGKDNDADLKRRGVITNFSEANPYLDVWNYYQPKDGVTAALEWGNSCPGDWLIVAGLPLFYGGFGLFLDQGEGNIGVGVHDASKLVAGKTYHFVLPLAPAVHPKDIVGQECPAPLPASSYGIRMTVFASTCTYDKSVFGRQESVRTTCPMAIGFKQCKEYCPDSIPPEECPNGTVAKRSYSLWERICAPGRMGPIKVTDAPSDDRTAWALSPPQRVGGLCVDQDYDQWFASKSGGERDGLQMYGLLVGDCDDHTTAIHPGALELCSDGLDNDCNGLIDCLDLSCANMTGCVPPQPTCVDGAQNQGETGIDCGGPCPPCAASPASCTDGIQNQGEISADCGGPCAGLPGYCPYGPGSDGWYCGDPALGQKAGSLYYCSKGSWSTSSATDCGAAGCRRASPCVPDSCDLPALCGDARCEPTKGETCATCLADCQLAAPVIGASVVTGSDVQLSWAATPCGARYRAKVCATPSMDTSSCITCPGSPAGSCESALGGTVIAVARALLAASSSWYWQASAIGSPENYGWGPWSATGSFALTPTVPATGGVPGTSVTYASGGVAGSSTPRGSGGAGGSAVTSGATGGATGGTTGCQDACTSGTQCSSATAQQTCVVGSNGCKGWGVPVTCPNGCANGACASQACGNGVKEGTEVCDGADVGGSSCISLGYSNGTLQCNGSCTGFSTAQCCYNECTSGTRCLDSSTQQSCGQYDSDACLDWGGGVSCANGCVGSSCTAACTSIYSQGFESPSLLSDDIVGSQLFTDGTQFYDASGLSRCNHGSGRSPSVYSLNVYTRSPGSADNTTLSFPAAASSTEKARISFWVYNPFVAAYSIVLQRAGGPAQTVSVPSQQWTQLTADLTSTMSTSAVILKLGLIPDSGGGFGFKIDDVAIQKCP
jgi:hypothetical protein